MERAARIDISQRLPHPLRGSCHSFTEVRLLIRSREYILVRVTSTTSKLRRQYHSYQPILFLLPTLSLTVNCPTPNSDTPNSSTVIPVLFFSFVAMHWVDIYLSIKCKFSPKPSSDIQVPLLQLAAPRLWLYFFSYRVGIGKDACEGWKRVAEHLRGEMAI
jgi:hypothetical protein